MWNSAEAIMDGVRELPRHLVDAFERSGRDLRILVVRLGAMGDILRTLPAVRHLHAALPEAEIRWLVESQWTLLLEGHPDLVEVIPVPRKQWRASGQSPARWGQLLSSVRGFRSGLRKTESQLSIDFHGNLRSGLVTWLAGAEVRVGYDGHQQKEGNRLFSTHRVPSGDRRTPRMTRNLSLIEALGVQEAPLLPCELPMATAGASAAEELIRSLTLIPGRYAIISPGASAAQSYKTPPPELLAAASQSLAERGIRSIVTYGPGELPLARAVVDRSKGHATLAPPTDLPTLAGLIAKAQLFIGGDSGPLHIACAVGCPVMGVYGPTDPQVNQPWGVAYRTLSPPGRTYTGIKKQDRTQRFEGLSTQAVVTTLMSLLEELAGGSTQERQPSR